MLLGEWLPMFQKNECLHPQGEEALPFLLNVGTHSPNSIASHPGTPNCSEPNIFQILKDAVKLIFSI
jgi:hypothetical protein